MKQNEARDVEATWAIEKKRWKMVEERNWQNEIIMYMHSILRQLAMPTYNLAFNRAS